MRCCEPPVTEAGRFFSWFARRSLRHYRKKGLGKSQRQLFDGITAEGIGGASVLEIGCGVGYLHQALLDSGAAAATGVDLSSRMLEEARTLAREQELESRTDYRVGDFVEISDALADADVTVLDKVVCCYPDARKLVRRSVEKTKRVYALTYPRPHLANRFFTLVEAGILRLIGCNFRPYVHDPGQIENWIRARGFRKQLEETTWIWLTQVYVR